MPLIDDLLDLQVPRNVRISPEGRHVVYTTSTISRARTCRNRAVSTVWTAETGRERSARRVTSGEFNDVDVEWRPRSDGEGKGEIGFVSDRAGPGEACGIYVLNLTYGGDGDGGEGGGRPYPLTPAGNRRVIEMFRWSPDGEFIAYVSADEKSDERRRREEEEGDDAHVWGQDLDFSRLRLVGVKTTEVRTLVEDSVHVTGMAWSPDGERIAFVHTKTPYGDSDYLNGSTVSVVEVATGSVRVVGHFGSAITKPLWVGKLLYFRANVDPTFLSSSQAIWSVDLESEHPRWSRRVHGDYDCAGDFVQADRDTIMVGGKNGVNEHIQILDGKVLQIYGTEVSSFHVRKLTSNNDEAILAIVESSVGRPAEVYSTTRSQGVHVQLSSHGDVVKQYQFGTATVLECQSSDQEVLLNAIYFSPANPKVGSGGSNQKSPFPTAVLCHGGPYARSIDSFDPSPTTWTPVLLEAGYGVLMPNYRGSSGRGDKFAGYARGRLGTIDYDDVITLTQHAIETGLADAEHLVIGGWSNGGAMANLATVRNGLHGHGWRFRAAVPGAAASDPDTMRLTSDLGAAFDLDSPRTAPWASDIDATDARRRTSAIWSFKHALASSTVKIPPVLILHGEQDKRVPIEQAVAMRRALQYHSLSFEFVSYPREGHRVVEYGHVKDRIQRVLRWADTYLSPA